MTHRERQETPQLMTEKERLSIEEQGIMPSEDLLPINC